MSQFQISQTSQGGSNPRLSSIFLMAAAMSPILSACGLPYTAQGTLSSLQNSIVISQEASLNCDVVVAGGSTAAMSAALTSAREGVSTCLIEPTDWVGGQLTAGGVPAVDFAWHKVGDLDVGAIGKNPANLPSELVAWMNAIGNPGGCWVSKNCFEPKVLLNSRINPAINSQPNLTTLRNTVVKNVTTLPATGDEKKITEVEVITRTVRPGIPWEGYDLRLSQDMADWYDRSDSSRYTKQITKITSTRPGGPVVIDATELGDVLALSQARYLQGYESEDGNPETSVTQCGQAVVFPFVMRFHSTPVPDNAPPLTPDNPEFYGLENFTWDRVWTYRRLKGSGTPKFGDLSLQNWNPGNDWPFGYIFKSPADTALEISDWKGGVNYASLDAAERHSYGWFRWYRDREPTNRAAHLNLAQDVFATGHGLSKFPYLRDTRRSVGIDNFVLLLGDIQGPAAHLTGKRFIDRIAVGAYNVDIHDMKSCTDYPKHRTDTLPFYIPLRALTNSSVSNLLVAGKTMAQSFLANSAIRLQPIEFSSGIGAGAAASVMVKNGYNTTREVLNAYAQVQSTVKKYAPIDLTINGLTWPRPGEKLEPLPQPGESLFCPPGTRADLQMGYCVDSLNAYGPFTNAMVKDCIRFGGGPACTATRRFLIEGRPVDIPRWDRTFAQALRGQGDCMKGSQRESKHPTNCVETPAQSASGTKEVYGPFGPVVVNRCLQAGGGDACYSNRWSWAFFDWLSGQN